MTAVPAFETNSTAQIGVRASYLVGGAATAKDDQNAPRLVVVVGAAEFRRRELRERYARMHRQQWWQDAYQGKSLGESLSVDQ